ncbi:dihydroxyacetone kinase subunit DhaL [Oceanobacillus sojae]|uniref:phosphoenolpyruvate--glycerone phosphotransferase n=1 Tax=Oceanobacillus sojae TaxID=582851 RepID=A0A511ZFT8_9BACI|nr:dihydroxyacetone kinase subunit DhaL [Oceanobacillus sojae]GEN86304.1 dihydroxyacetone kinase subunit L [Oceanobacillus sojae]
MEQLTVQETQAMLIFVADNLIEAKEMLCEIDGKIGDGDHGFGIARGFNAVKETLNSNTYATVNNVFKDIGMSMLRSMGGASGVIFSSMFLGAGTLPDLAKLNTESLTSILREGLKKVKAQGKAKMGDKTMVDAYEPAVIALEQSQDSTLETALKSAVLAAEDGVRKTKEYPAKHGRAKFLYDRSIGIEDAGATTVSLIFKAMYNYLSTKNS